MPAATSSATTSAAAASAAASATPPPAPEKIILRGVHFDFDKSNIRPQDAAVLDEAAETLKAHPNVSVNVNGYCDMIGSVRYNLRLSERRSNAVVKYLGGPRYRGRPHEPARLWEDGLRRYQ